MLTNFCCAAAGSGAANARATAAQAAASPRVVFFLPKVCLTDLRIQTPFEDFHREYAGRSGDRCVRGGARCLWRRDSAQTKRITLGAVQPKTAAQNRTLAARPRRC